MPATTDAPDIRAARKTAGLSQQELARRVNCSIGWIRQIEAGVKPGSQSRVYGRILEALKVDDPGRQAEVAEDAGAAAHDQG